MTQCPSCAKNVNEDFGLVTCSSCGAQFMVGIDGQAVASEVSRNTSVSKIKTLPTEVPIENEIAEAVLQDTSVARFNAEIPIEAASAEVPTMPSQIMPPPIPDEVVTSETSMMNQANQVLRPRQAPRQNTGKDMGDIAQFANSESSLGREGLLRYNIYISGVDTKDLRYEVKEILTDGKFRWNVDEIMASIVDGEIRLMEVPAVKSALIIQKLKVLPLEIRWEQYSITQN